jgi:hypothetical protein
MVYNSDVGSAKKHPGWAIHFQDDTWLGGAHGYIRTNGALYAYTFPTKESAEKVLNHLRNSPTESKYFSEPAEIVEAWEPLCENLRAEVSSLKKTNVVEYLDIFDLRTELESILNRIKEWEEKGKKIKSGDE